MLRAFSTFLVWVCAAHFACPLGSISTAYGAGGELTLNVEEESDNSPTISRVEIWRGAPSGKTVPVRRTVSAGIGVVLDRSAVLALNDGSYAFRMIRGPEYRIVTGTFSLEDTSLDGHSVQLPRMIDMLSKGWTSGDCCVVASPNSLPLRMASEDLHVATTLGHTQAKPIPLRKSDDPIDHEPTWIQTNAKHLGGLIFYGEVPDWDTSDKEVLPVSRMVDTKKVNADTKVAIENPFAWELPVWLASQKVDGFFLMGDWLRLDRKVLSVSGGRKPIASTGGGQALGRWAEEIYRNVLDAGIQIPPLAGGGSNSANTPVGYNRLYVGRPLEAYEQQENDLEIGLVKSSAEWWQHAWAGHSVVTNGPMLRPQLSGKAPGHTFEANAGEELELLPELSLATRDPVEYLEVIHNNRVHYSARLKEYAEAKGRIPPLTVDRSGWVIYRVVTLHQDHYRAAVSAPWYIQFGGEPRVSKRSVAFFQKWLGEHEKRLKRLPADQLRLHVPYVQAARRFWAKKSQIAVD